MCFERLRELVNSLTMEEKNFLRGILKIGKKSIKKAGKLENSEIEVTNAFKKDEKIKIKVGKYTRTMKKEGHCYEFYCQQCGKIIDTYYSYIKRHGCACADCKEVFRKAGGAKKAPHKKINTPTTLVHEYNIDLNNPGRFKGVKEYTEEEKLAIINSYRGK